MIDALMLLAGPLGPLGSLSDREEARIQLHRELDEQDGVLLIEILYQADDVAQGCQQEAVEALTALARREPATWLRRVEAVMQQRGPNEGLIELLGSLRHPDAGRVLIRLRQIADLDEREQIALACSLGEIGGEQVYEELRKMRSLVTDRTSELAQEIEIALSAIRDVESNTPTSG